MRVRSYKNKYQPAGARACFFITWDLSHATRYVISEKMYSNMPTLQLEKQREQANFGYATRIMKNIPEQHKKMLFK